MTIAEQKPKCAKPCKSCPYRDAPEAFGYDADALEALDDGGEPACHAIVGPDNVFAHEPMPPDPSARCRGHDLWMAETPGYRRPVLVTTPLEAET